ncbi:MAG TPA: SIMPL domain-containing protein [Thermoanaerobaculia bacterium]|nr:SIMPL domain-containing protein [Thermoanaerobaculia bacterium]
MEDRRSLLVPAAVLGLLLALGLAAGGALLARGLFAARAADRFVTVKGLSEREVPADLALWPIVFTNTGNDLSALQEQVEQDAAAIRGFLGRFGFEPGEATLSAPRVTDYLAQGGYRDQGPAERYLVESTVTLRSGDIEAVRRAIQASGELVRAGVALIRSYEYNTQYLFTQLEAVKPEMIAEATRDARRAAEQFAEDSGARVGGIRRAQQGYFSIEDRDPFSPETKKVRVVTTVEYFLVE